MIDPSTRGWLFLGPPIGRFAEDSKPRQYESAAMVAMYAWSKARSEVGAVFVV